MNLTTIEYGARRVCVLVSLAACLSFDATAQVQVPPQTPGPFSDIFTEKWPPNASQTFVTLTSGNAVSEYLRANFGKLGELAAHRLDKCLASLVCRAKLSATAVARVVAIFNDASLSDSQKGQAFIQAVEEDIAGGPTSPATGDLAVVASYAPSFGVTKLVWSRFTSRAECIKDTYTCPDGHRVINGQMCPVVEIIGGQYFYRSVFPSVSRQRDTIDSEAKYIISRDNKVLAVFPEVTNLASSSMNFTIGGFSLSLSGVLPAGSSVPEGNAGPFYDLDPQFTPLSKPLTYQIQAVASGCGPNYDNSYVGNTSKFTTIVVDANGDGRPDFYPAADWFKKLPHVAGQIATQAVIPLLLSDDPAPGLPW